MPNKNDELNDLLQDMEKYSEYPKVSGTKPYLDFIPTNNISQTLKNIITAKVQRNQLIYDSAERNEVDSDEIDDFLRKNYTDKGSIEYLVDGAILTCTNSTSQVVRIQDSREYLVNPYMEYTVPENAMLEEVQIPSLDFPKVLGRLSVTENPSAEDNGLKHATIYDSKMKDNIPYFGNCKRLPDCESEKAKFYQACERGGAEFRKEGTCKYLMKLETVWENYDIGTDYLQYIDDEKGQCSGITMTSMLFCKHGGFIYPITSGQKIQLLDQEEQELTDEEGDELVREKIMIAPWLRAYKGLPTREGGTKIDLLTEKRNTIPGADWYAYEPQINEYAIKQYEKKGKVLDDQVYDINDAHVNNLKDYRYWVGVGPEIACPGYNETYSYEEQTLNESQFEYGTEIDVVLQNTKNNEIVYIECIVGDVKGHTYPDGIYHTGDPYPNSNLTDKKQADGSYIEFITERDDGKRNGTMSDYVVTDIIVYEREW